MRRTLTLIALLIITGLMFGCGGSSSTTPSAAAKVSSAVTITGSVVDANTGTSLDATVTAVDTATQTKLAVTRNSTGNYSVTLDQAPAKDMIIAISAAYANYNDGSTTVTVSSTSGVKFYPATTLSLVPVTEVSVNGVVSKIATDSIALQDLVVIGTKTTATVQAGTKLYDVSGIALDTAKPLTLTTTMYDQSATGLAPNPSNSIFATAGFTEVSVKDINGRIAKTASKDVTIKMYVDGAQIYDANGNSEPLVEGSSILLETYNKNTGAWEQDMKATDTATAATGVLTVRKGLDGKLFVEYTVTHFSYWNLSFTGIQKCGVGTNPVLGPLTFSISGAALTLKAVNPLYPTVKFTDGIKPPADPSVTLQNVPASGTTTVTAYYDGLNVGTKQIFKCAYVGGSQMTLNIPYPTVNWTVERKCRFTAETQPLANVVLYDCSSTATSLLDPSCKMVTATNSSGVAAVLVTTVLDHLYVQPTAMQKSAWAPGQPSVWTGNPVYGANAVQDMMVSADGNPPIILGNATLVPDGSNTGGKIQYVDGLWEFCTTTGANP